VKIFQTGPTTDFPEVAWLAEALRRGTKRSKLRVLDIACPHDHRLAEVFRTPMGLVAMGLTARGFEDVTPGVVHPPGRSRDVVEAGRVVDTPPGITATTGGRLRVQCACRAESIDAASVLAQIEAGRHRMIWPV
jgi:hypothetical protein